MKKVAVIILNWNGRSLLEQYLPALLKHTPEELADIIVADNASDDDSVAFIQAHYPAIRLICLEQNYGFALGYNKVLEDCKYEYAVILNSDVEVTENWLEPLYNYLEMHPEVAAAQPKLLSLRNRNEFEYAGAAGGYLDKYGYPFCRGRIQQHIETDTGQYDTVQPVFWASGACLFIRTKDFHDLKGFDANFFAHQEEIDLCWRLGTRGRQVVCIPSSVVYHLGGASLSNESPRKTFLNFRNNLLMLYKNLPEKDLRKVMMIRSFLDLLAAAMFLLTAGKENARAVLKARRSFNQMKKEYEGIRSEEQKVASGTVALLMYRKSIVLDYYLKGKKTFAQLKF